MLAACTGVMASRPSFRARRPRDRPVDQAVDRVVDSRLSRGITRAFLWISRINKKNLEITGQKPLRQFPQPEYKFIYRQGGRPSGRKLPGRRGNPGDGKPGQPGFQLLLPTPGGRRQNAREPGNRQPSVTQPGGAPPTHTWRGPILMCGALAASAPWAQAYPIRRTEAAHPRRPRQTGPGSDQGQPAPTVRTPPPLT